MNLEFDTSKPHTLADLASAHNLTEDEVATNLWRECYIDFGVGLTELGKSKMPGLLFPSGQAGGTGTGTPGIITSLTGIHLPP